MRQQKETKEISTRIQNALSLISVWIKSTVVCLDPQKKKAVLYVNECKGSLKSLWSIYWLGIPKDDDDENGLLKTHP